MTKKALPLLTGGLNEKTRPDLIDDDQLQICTNYEIVGDGYLYRRKATSNYDDALNTEIQGVFSSVSYISEPYYPQQPLKISGEEMDGDFILFVYGYTESAYELHAFFSLSGSWTNLVDGTNSLTSLLSGANITYTSNSDPQIVIGSDKVIITDGVNRAHFVSVDTDGVMRAGVLGIPAPTNKARVTEMTEWQDDLWETDSTATRLSTPGLFQCVYTVVTEHGEESNPSPLSDTLDMQFFKLDADGLDERWLEKVEIKDLSIPDVPDNIQDILKYFKVYMRVIKYSEGEGTAALEFTQQFDIVNKVNAVSGTTGNDYTLTVAPTAGDIASWENDVAPIAKTGAELGGITMVGNVKTKISFPWEFKYYHPITINNTDSKSYVDAVIRIRLHDQDSTNDDAIDNFEVTDFVASSGHLTDTSHIRIFDSDTTTPLAVCYNGYNDSSYVDRTEDGSYVDLFIKIPLLTAGSPHTIYLCWTPDGESGYAGVPDTYNSLTDSDFTWSGNIGIHYGRFMEIGHNGWTRQQVWSGLRVESNAIGVDDFEGVVDTVSNKADDVPVTTTSISTEDNFFVLPTINKLIGSKVVVFDSTASKIDYDHSIDGSTGISMPERGTIFLRLSMQDLTLLGWTNYIQTDQLREIFTVYGDTNSFFSLILYTGRNTNGNNYPRDFYLRADNETFWDVVKFGQNIQPYLDLDDISSFVLDLAFSWNYAENDESELSLFLKRDINDDYFSIKVEDIEEKYFTLGAGIKGVRLGNFDYSAVKADTKINDYRFLKDLYLDSDSTDDLNKFKNMCNLMPIFDNMIGYDYTNHNQNINFDETKEIEFKEQKNMVKWTDVNYQSFPDLFYKKVREPILKIIPAPSFLQFEYQNTFIIFTRNSINRFVLEGSADGWSGSSSSLIEEKTQYGLLAPESLVRAGDALFWLSEVGVVMWGKDGMNLISKNVVNVRIDEGHIGFYSPLNNRYILHKKYWEDSNITVGMSPTPPAGISSANSMLAVPNESPFLVNDVIKIDDEFMLITGFMGDYLYIDRGYLGTTPATHYAGAIIYYKIPYSYVYHIERNAWSKFFGLDIISVATLTSGDEYDNINLLLNSSNGILQFPTETYTSKQSEIQTKDLVFEKGTLRRMKVDYSGTFVYVKSVMTTQDSSGNEIVNTNSITNPNPDHWRGIALKNSRGKKLSFKIENADVIKHIMYDLKQEE